MVHQHTQEIGLLHLDHVPDLDRGQQDGLERHHRKHVDAERGGCLFPFGLVGLRGLVRLVGRVDRRCSVPYRPQLVEGPVDGGHAPLGVGPAGPLMEVGVQGLDQPPPNQAHLVPSGPWLHTEHLVGVGQVSSCQRSMMGISSGSVSATASGSTSYSGTRGLGRSTVRMPSACDPEMSS